MRTAICLLLAALIGCPLSAQIPIDLGNAAINYTQEVSEADTVLASLLPDRTGLRSEVRSSEGDRKVVDELYLDSAALSAFLIERYRNGGMVGQASVRGESSTTGDYQRILAGRRQRYGLDTRDVVLLWEEHTGLDFSQSTTDLDDVYLGSWRLELPDGGVDTITIDRRPNRIRVLSSLRSNGRASLYDANRIEIRNLGELPSIMLIYDPSSRRRKRWVSLDRQYAIRRID
jgi:hypothetical protein